MEILAAPQKINWSAERSGSGTMWYHHLFVINEGQRTLMQAPSVDGGSEWFESLSGKNSFSGTLTFTVKNHKNKLPWDNMQVL